MQGAPPAARGRCGAAAGSGEAAGRKGRAVTRGGGPGRGEGALRPVGPGGLRVCVCACGKREKTEPCQLRRGEKGKAERRSCGWEGAGRGPRAALLEGLAGRKRAGEAFYSILSACNKLKVQEINFSCARGVVSCVKKNLFNPLKTQAKCWILDTQKCPCASHTDCHKHKGAPGRMPGLGHPQSTHMIA